jgi:molybdenum cofactor cytidylyltransferase
MSSSRPCVVVLAAGQGGRFAGDRRKVTRMLDGASVLATTLGNAIASGLPVVVVTTVALAPLAGQHVAARDVVELPDVTELGYGIGRSIAAGVAARADAPGWLVLPADMPLVQPGTLAAVAAALDEHPVTYAQHQGRRGHPVGFAAELYSELVVLRGDDGARRIVARYPSFGVDVDDPGTLLDVDAAGDPALRRMMGGAAALERSAG